jgi:hypothetical protein
MSEGLPIPRWVFAAGIPDPRKPPKSGGAWPNVPMVHHLSWQMAADLYTRLGMRYHPELAEEWVVLDPKRPNDMAKIVSEKPEDVDEGGVIDIPSLVNGKTAAQFLAEHDPMLLAEIIDADTAEKKREVGLRIAESLKKAGVDADQIAKKV